MSNSDIPSTDIHGVPTSLPDDLVLLDVREPDEWAAGHVEGAVHIPLGDLPSRVAELDPTARTLVMCHLGGRSARATSWLRSQGHDATNIDGGMEAWEQSGRPIIRG